MKPILNILQAVNKNKLLLVIVSVITNSFIHTVQAQSVANYSVTRTTGITYSSISSTGNSIASWRYTGGFSEDDNRSELTDIGFDFWYNGTRYTQFSVSTNGFIDFSTSTDDGGPNCDDYGYCNFQFSASNVANGTWLSLAPFYDDMTTGGGVDPLGTSIKFLTSGSAPNRVLTIEWISMAVFGNTTPDLNFQVKLYETTGVIEFIYGTMNNGTNTFSYTIGINANSVSAPPTATELLTQQAANTTTFNNTAQNNLTTMPTNNSRLTFTPPVPAAPIGTLSFTGVTNTGMTLNWTDWASNEVGYAIYYSLDGTNYFFNSQTAAGANSENITGLLPSTTYFWRLFAVTEGTLSSALTGSQATLAPATVTSTRNGRWDRTATWDCACIPSAGDNVVIRNTDRVTLRSTNEVCNDLTVSGELRIGRNNTQTFDLTVNSNLTINGGGRVHVRTGSNTTHTLNVGGNISNTNELELNPDANSHCHVNFFSIDRNQSISGAGITTNFYTFDLSKGEKDNTVEILTTNFSCDPEALTISNAGTFKFSSPGTNTFAIYNTTREIPRNGKIWMNSTNGQMSFNGGITLNGDLILDNGTINIGNAADENLAYNGGVLEINDGSLNISGRYEEVDDEAQANFNMSGGILRLPTLGSTSATNAPFSIDNTGSSFSMSNGTIEIEREGGTDLGFINTGSNAGTVSGGTLQIGNGTTPAGQTMQINSTKEIGNLHINSANATAQLITNNLVVLQNVTISSGQLNSGTQNLSFGGDWSNTGGTNTPGTGTITLNGTSDQSINKTTGSEDFNNIILDGSGTKTLSTNANFTGNITINSILDVDATNNSSIALDGNFVNNGTFRHQKGLVSFVGTGAQQIIGNNTTFYDITLNNASGTSIVSGNDSLVGTLTLTLGNFSTNNSFTLISNAAGTARIAEITGGSISGDITMQRYIDAGATNWRFITSAVSGATLADLNDDFITSGFIGSDFPDFPTVTNRFVSISYYDETHPGILDSGFVGATNVTNPINVGEGLWVWSGDTITGTDPFTIDIQGPANTGNINLPLSYTPSMGANDDGWNMVGNPYPSTIDWDSPSITKTGVNNAIYIWNPDLEQFATYIGGMSTNGGSRYIASSQAFWLQANSASASVQLTEACKDTTNTPFIKQGSSPRPLTINVQNSFGTDQTIINFEENATNGFDSRFDAGKITSANPRLPNISSSMPNDETQYTINQLPTSETTIFIKVTSGLSGFHTFSFLGASNFANNSCLLLEDLFTGNIYDINNISSFSVFIRDTTSIPRFLLRIGVHKNITSNNTSCYGLEDGSITFEKETNTPFNLTCKNSNGDIIENLSNINGEATFNNLKADSYLIESDDPTCGNTIDTVTINEPEQIMANFELNKDTLRLPENDTAHFINLSSNASNFSWDFGDGNSSSLSNPSHRYDESGTYTFTLTASQSSTCEQQISSIIFVSDFATSVEEINSKEVVKIWIDQNKLFVNNKNTVKIEIRNILGQLLISSKNNYYINLNDISSQTLISTIFLASGDVSSQKIQFINLN